MKGSQRPIQVVLYVALALVLGVSTGVGLVMLDAELSLGIVEQLR